MAGSGWVVTDEMLQERWDRWHDPKVSQSDRGHAHYGYFSAVMYRQGTLTRSDLEVLLASEFGPDHVFYDLDPRYHFEPQDVAWLLERLPADSAARRPVLALAAIQDPQLRWDDKLRRVIALGQRWAALRVLSSLGVADIPRARELVLTLPERFRSDLLMALSSRYRSLTVSNQAFTQRWQQRARQPEDLTQDEVEELLSCPEWAYYSFASVFDNLCRLGKLTDEGIERVLQVLPGGSYARRPVEALHTARHPGPDCLASLAEAVRQGGVWPARPIIAALPAGLLASARDLVRRLDITPRTRDGLLWHLDRRAEAVRAAAEGQDE